MRLATLATCSLGQWALDFEGNAQRIKESIRRAKALGATYRLGPELEVSGYGCEDHFLESDTFLHCWEVLAEILDSDLTEGILCDVGMPIFHNNVRYNCRVFLLNRKVLFIRPKMALADDGNYRESRWFTRWTHRNEVVDYYLPRVLREVTGQSSVPIGDGCLALADTCLSSETCEELFSPDSPHIPLGLDGIEILGNGSASHHQLRKLHQRMDLIRSATSKMGGIYLYANQQCCDGGRLYYDGCSLIAMNGQVYAQGSQFSMSEVEVVVATLNLVDVRNYRGSIASRGVQAADARTVPRINVDFNLTHDDVLERPSRPMPVKYHTVDEEIAYGPACWLWDYLRRSGLSGFFLPLSGGADSASTACIVGVMLKLLMKEVRAGNSGVIADVRRVGKYGENELPKDFKELSSRIFHTAYLGAKHSSTETRERSAEIARQVGSSHSEVEIDQVTDALSRVVKPVLHHEPKFKTSGGSWTENLALQNIQARSRMVLSYFLAQLLLWDQGVSGSLLVLGSGNVDEALRGYLTKYDCSSADINPIGGIGKRDLNNFLKWAATEESINFPVMAEVAVATPTAELEPVTAEYVQTDEIDMGMTYDELSVYARLRKMEHCGPFAMFTKLCWEWDHLPAFEVANKVKHFFRSYSINRHKCTTLTPSYHAESYSPDDNRFDLRPFLYPQWKWQFRKVDELAAKITEARRASKGPGEQLSPRSTTREPVWLEDELLDAQRQVQRLQEQLTAMKKQEMLRSLASRTDKTDRDELRSSQGDVEKNSKK